MHLGKHKHQNEHGWSEKLEEKFIPQPQANPTSISVIIPTYNCSERVAMTLQSLREQEYSPLEVIIVDAESTDKTLQVINPFCHWISRIYTVNQYNIFDMLNRGILLAKGEYITFVFPGTLYTVPHAFLAVDETIKKYQRPHVVYCGSFHHEGRRDARLIFQPFDVDLLKTGKQPTTLSACWFRTDIFDVLGKFNKTYRVRGGFDFLTRCALDTTITKQSFNRVYVDFDYGSFNYTRWIQYASNTWRILHDHFGFFTALKWFLGINHIDFARFWLRSKKTKGL